MDTPSYMTIAQAEECEHRQAEEKLRQESTKADEAEARRRAEEQARALAKWKAAGRADREFADLLEREVLAVSRCNFLKSEIEDLERQCADVPKNLQADKATLDQKLAEAETRFALVETIADAQGRIVELLALRELVRVWPTRQTKLKEQVEGLSKTATQKKAELKVATEKLNSIQKEVGKRRPKP